MAEPYFDDGTVILYHGDCREITEWTTAAVLVTDPPYGRAWRQGRARRGHHTDDSHGGISGDENTSTRDQALAMWGARPAIVFGDLMLPPPMERSRYWPTGRPPTRGTRERSAGSVETSKRSTSSGHGLPGSMAAAASSPPQHPCKGALQVSLGVTSIPTRNLET